MFRYNPKKDKLCFCKTHYIPNISEIKSIYDYLAEHKGDVVVQILVAKYVEYDIKTKIDNLKKKEKRSESFAKIFNKLNKKK